ncbi:MAG: hypothetical protein R3B90_04775 [Planctomycetaceae bacterium]
MVQPQDLTGKHKAHVEVFLDRDAATAGETVRVAFVVSIEESWHLEREST